MAYLAHVNAIIEASEPPNPLGTFTLAHRLQEREAARDEAAN